MSCENCPYKGEIKVPYVGNRNAKIVIMGEAPAVEEVKLKKPFVGESGKLLFTTLDYYTHLTRKDVAIINAVKCKVDNQDKKSLTKALKACRPNVENILKKLKPKLIVAFGSTAVRQILKDGSKITTRSGTFEWSDEFNCWVLISIHPSYALRNGVTVKSISQDNIKLSKAGKLWVDTFKILNNFIENGYKKIDLDTSKYIEFKEEHLKYILSKRIVAFDYETNGLNPFSNDTKILSVSFSVDPNKSMVIVFDTDIDKKIEWVKKILTSKLIKVVANRPFEEIWTKQKFGFDITQPVHDVLTMAHLVHEENCFPYSLEQVASRYAGMLHIKEIAEGQRETLEKADKNLIIRYNGVDSDATLRSYNKLISILKTQPSVLNYYINLTYKAQTLYARLEQQGIYIDITNAVKHEEQLKNIADDLVKKALSLLPKSIKEEYKDNLTLTRAAIINDYLFLHKDGLKLKPLELTEKTRIPTTTEKHLKNFSRYKFVEYLLDWKKANKILTTYFPQLYNSINKKDSKIYPHTFFISTKTGRLSIKNPPLQTIPQRGIYSKYIKQCFKAPDGYYFFDRDLGQSELRIMGWISKCKGIMRALNEGIDLHKNTVNMLFGTSIDKVTKEQRQQAKAINFGFIYGASAKAFQQIAKNDYGVEFTIEEAEELREKFFKAYPEILDWHRKTVMFARKYGYVESPLGRRRHLEFINSDDFFLKSEAERQAVNFPIQSISSDINLISQIIFQKYIDKYRLNDRIVTLFLVHDALYGFVKKEDLELAIKSTKYSMEVLSKKYIKKYFNVNLNYPIASSFSYGEDWGNMEEIDD